MATRKQLEGLRKARNSRKSKRHGKKRSFGTLGAAPKSKSFMGLDLSQKTLLDVLKNGGLVVGGYVLGNAAIAQGAKMINPNAETGYKQYAAPAVVLVGGGLAATMKNEMAKYIGIGVMAAGAVNTVNTVLGAGKDITKLETLKGLTLNSILGNTEPMTMLPLIDSNVNVDEYTQQPAGYVLKENEELAS